MKLSKSLLIPALGIGLLQSCSEGPKPETNQIDSTQIAVKDIVIQKEEPIITKASIRELSDEEYPDNPDISIRHNLDGTFAHSEVDFVRNKETKNFDIIIYPENDKSDTILIKNINLLEWIPAVPEHIKQDEYLTKIGIINQEWNRQQVKFRGETFEVQGQNLESKSLVRVDLARNCLNSYLWEIIAYSTNDEGKEAPSYHGWFNFPEQLYTDLYFERNNLQFEDLKASLVHWIDPENKPVNFNLLRTAEQEIEIKFTSHNDKLYPLVGERKKKNPNIVKPKEAKTINDFLNNGTEYGTFTPPGYYNTSDPRKTELGSLAQIEKVVTRKITSANRAKTEGLELELFFKDIGGNITTRLVIGGLDTSKFPTLNPDEAHKGFQMPMGIANHSFYETVEILNKNPSKENPYYAFLLDEKGNWLDSHKIGIDGPLFHFDKEGKLHLWILSFERHSFVGHFELELK